MIFIQFFILKMETEVCGTRTSSEVWLSNVYGKCCTAMCTTRLIYFILYTIRIFPFIHIVVTSHIGVSHHLIGLSSIATNLFFIFYLFIIHHYFIFTPGQIKLPQKRHLLLVSGTPSDTTSVCTSIHWQREGHVVVRNML